VSKLLTDTVYGDEICVKSLLNYEDGNCTTGGAGEESDTASTESLSWVTLIRSLSPLPPSSDISVLGMRDEEAKISSQGII
jgi:hypothetical protein